VFDVTIAGLRATDSMPSVPQRDFDTTVSPRTVHREVNAATAGKDIIPVAATDLFDASRFASPPEG
jgi:hypothetical protein